ncbi:hypothetical protein GCM10029992_17920 [Glycomyces albus]
MRAETDSGPLGLRIATEYPRDGEVRIEVTEAPEAPVELRLRVPHWAEGATLTDQAGSREVEPGWAQVRGDLAPGAAVTLHLPTEPRLTWPDERVDAVRGCVAVERGPLVLCVESADLPAGWAIEDVRIDTAAPPRPDGDGALARISAAPAPPRPVGRPPFGPTPPAARSGPEWAEVPLVPYHRWARRGGTGMRVFLPTA